MNNSPVAVVERSENAKLSKNGHVSATYVSQTTCPNSCPLKGKGCYAEYGKSGMINRRLNSASEKRPVMVAKAEAEGIKELTGKFPLRLHVVGDAYDKKSAEVLAEAAEVHTSKFGMPVWTYTHNHTTPRSSWGNISVFRSCETLRQAETAIKAGYSAVLIVEKFKSNKMYPIGRGLYGIPCPAQIDKTKSCTDCKLCMIDKNLQKKNMVILLQTHGNGKRYVNEILREGKK